MEETNVFNNIQVKKIVRFFISIMVVFGFSNSLFAPVFMLYAGSKGINTFEFNMILSALMITVFIFEIPAGAFADVFGQKKSFIISMILMSIAKIIFLFSGNMIEFIAGSVVDGLAFAFFSGTIDAWTINEVKKLGVQHYEKIFARLGKLSGYATILGGFVGGYLIKANYNFVWMLSAALYLIIAGAAFIKMHEENNIIDRSKLGFRDGLKQMGKIAKTSWTVIVNRKMLLFLVLIDGYEIFLVGGTSHLWQKYLPDILGAVEVVSWVWMIVAIGKMIGSHIAEKLNIRQSRKIDVMMGTYVIIAAMFVLSGLVNNGYAIILFLFVRSIIGGIKQPFMSSILNENIGDEHRSTSLSFKSQINSVFQNVGLIVMGWIAQYYGIPFGWLTTGILLLGVYLIWGVMRPGYKSQRQISTTT